MKKYCLLCFALFSLNVFGTPMPVPPEIKGTINFSTDLLDKKALNGAKKIADSPFYYGQTRGGSTLLGLLLGPVGVLINGSLVADKTATESRNDVLKENFDLYKLVQNSISNSQNAENKSNVYLEPFVLIRSDQNDQIMVSLVYLVAVKNGSDMVWREKYYYHMDKMFPKAVVMGGTGSEFQEYLLANVPKAVSALSDFVISDLSTPTPSSSQVKVKSDYFGWLPGPFDSLLLSNNNGVSKVRVNANDVFENMYARGTHVFDNAQAEIK